MVKSIEKQEFGRLLGISPAMRKVFSLIEKTAQNAMPVLIIGDTGTGKELVAREIHDRSDRRDGPFVAVNTGAISSELVASELFGHKKGAFTGATEDRIGRFCEAKGGTLFLDEIGTMDERTQITLLRVLENRQYRPVGAKRDIQSEIRLIAATNDDLDDATDRGLFREDLLHRLKVLSIQLPTLKERLEDIGLLSDHFINCVNEEYDFQIAGLSDNALDAMKRYFWPGNLRELKNVIAQACVLTESGMIDFDHLPERISKADRVTEIKGRNGSHTQYAQNGADKSSSEERGLKAKHAEDGLFIPLGATLEEVQKQYALRTLDSCSNNKTRAAEVLGVSRKTLYDKLLRWQRN